MSQTTLHIAEQDNVMVALRAIAGGTKVDGVTVASDVADDRSDLQPDDQVLLIVEDDSTFARILLDRSLSPDQQEARIRELAQQIE